MLDASKDLSIQEQNKDWDWKYTNRVGEYTTCMFAFCGDSGSGGDNPLVLVLTVIVIGVIALFLLALLIAAVCDVVRNLYNKIKLARQESFDEPIAIKQSVDQLSNPQVLPCVNGKTVKHSLSKMSV
ncbi:hypothetical protein EHRUM4_08780 [Ehrlichia ruminantium]|uniref:Uncharacterized protein n=1 Tax=Ehrlichia ruminantium TaxID=779 RepID=A0A170QYS8_EHRRU|nr:hypothetical protein [Ehrlichia ruminantium]GAT75654.1 hypothetical protein EHRUM4_08780 [Ehrlichia ruminantium]GAT77624.1 hypothetical protein EHRUM2_08510 [Ehrlichia ruminantium]GAT78788.1 hypothetical protein EHRUM3_10180 [Ehrlichia ruminantium]